MQGFSARELSFHELFTEMKNANNLYELDFSTVTFLPETDSFYTGKKIGSATENLNISAVVEFQRVKFDQRVDLVIRGLVFEKKIIFRNCTFSNLVLEHCLFQEGFILDDCVVRNLEVSHCSFSNQTIITDNNMNGQLKFEQCDFGISATAFFQLAKNFRIPVTVITQNGPGVKNLLFSHCKFNGSESTNNQFYLDLSGSQFGNIAIGNSLFNVYIDLENAEILNEFMVSHSAFNKGIDTKNLELKESAMRFDWDQITGKGLMIMKSGAYGDSITGDSKWVTGFSKNQSRDETDFLFQSLKSNYAKFIRAFRTQRDFMNVSKVTREWKKLENNYYWMTATSQFTGIKEKGILRVKIFMNYLLGVVSDHGTNPQKVVLYSFLVVMIFSFFFFFIPSKTFPMFSSRFYSNMEMLSRYFSTGNSLRHLLYEYRVERKIFTEKEDYADYVDANKTQIPFYLRIFAMPFFSFITQWNRNIYFWLLKKISFLDGKWSGLSFWKKIIKNTFVFVLFFSYLIFLCTKRFLWAVLQSINAFVTFGFGRLSAPKNAGLVLAILEGFSGWFLMSVFVVSLLFQLLS